MVSVYKSITAPLDPTNAWREDGLIRNIALSEYSRLTLAGHLQGTSPDADTLKKLTKNRPEQLHRFKDIFQDDMNKYLCEHSDTHDKQLDETNKLINLLSIHYDIHGKQLKYTNKCLREQIKKLETDLHTNVVIQEVMCEQIKKLETDLHTNVVIQEEMCEQMNQYELQNNIIMEQTETNQQLFMEQTETNQQLFMEQTETNQQLFMEQTETNQQLFMEQTETNQQLFKELEDKFTALDNGSMLKKYIPEIWTFNVKPIYVFVFILYLQVVIRT